MNSLLDNLEKNRTPILLAEIGVWLHLLGKLSEEFIDEQTGRQIPKPERMRKGYVKGVFELMNPLQLDANFFNFARDKNFWSSNVINNLKSIINNLTDQDSQISLEEVVSFHRPGDYEKYNGKNFYLKLIVASHNTSGAEEKDLPWTEDDPRKKIKQSCKDKTYAATAFGFEDRPIIRKTNLGKVRNSLLSSLSPILEHIKNNHSILDFAWWHENYHKIISEFEKAYKVTVGDTQRPVNDVTLWDAASLASALFKSALAKMILEGWTEPIDADTKETAIRWKILRINFDSLSIMAKGIKIGDILGYRNAIEDAISECKKIIEIKYCLGNEIYYDQTGAYFSFPDVDAKSSGFWNALVAELRSTIQKIELELSPYIEISAPIPDFKDLTSQRVSALEDIAFPHRDNVISQEFSNLWSDKSSNSEVCPICRLRPMKEISDGCEHCLGRRKHRAESWIENPKHTIWLDEVSDHNDRVALLVGSFSLTDWLNGKLISTMAKKTPSSGRIRRCWESTQEFIKSMVFGNILSNFAYGKESPNLELRKKRIQFKLNQNVPNIPKGATLDIVLEGIKLSPVYIDETREIFVNTMNLQILQMWGKTEKEIASAIQGKRVKIKINSQPKDNFLIAEASSADEKFQNYIPYVQIYDFPDQFMAIVPAYDALDIAAKIVEEYEIQFSKVRDRLPFHIGIIAFHRRTPLYVVMDAGKRLIETFKKKTKTINATVESIQELSDNKLGNKVKELTLKVHTYSPISLKWKISYSTGDPNQPDEWHPYFRLNGSNSNRRNYSFDYDGNGNYVVHVKGLQPNDCVNIESSYFKLAYLENAAERFKVGDELRPLDDIKRLDELWRDICNILNKKNLGISLLYAYWQEVKKRHEDYKGDSAWEEFVKSSLINILQVSPEKDREIFDKLFQATKDGLLDICLNWNLQVRKIKPERLEVKK